MRGSCVEEVTSKQSDSETIPGWSGAVNDAGKNADEVTTQRGGVEILQTRL